MIRHIAVVMVSIRYVAKGLRQRPRFRQSRILRRVSIRFVAKGLRQHRATAAERELRKVSIRFVAKGLRQRFISLDPPSTQSFYSLCREGSSST